MAREWTDFNTPDQIKMAATAELRPALPVTISAWIHPNSGVAVEHGIFGNNHSGFEHYGVWFDLTSAYKLVCSFGDGTGNASSDRRTKLADTAVTADVWTHTAATIRGATDMTLYRAGMDDGGTYSGTGGALGYNTLRYAEIGHIRNASGDAVFRGALAEIAFWDVSLSASEIGDLADGADPRDIQLANLIGYWPLCGVDSPEPDLATNDNDGTLVGNGLDTYSHPPLGPGCGVQEPEGCELILSDEVLFVDATYQDVNVLLLPSDSLPIPSRIYYIKRIDNSGFAVTIDGNGALIDGVSTFEIEPYDSVGLVTDGYQWYRV